MVSGVGLVQGTYLHGLLENDAARHGLIDSVRAWRQARSSDESFAIPRHRMIADREAQLDRLAAMVRASLDLRPLLAARGLG